MNAPVRDESTPECQVDEVAHEPVSEAPDRCAGGLRGTHRIDDLPVRGVGNHLVRHDLEGTNLVDGSGIHRVTGGHVDRHGLPGDPGLVQAGPTGSHGAVDRHASARSDDDGPAHAHLAQRDRVDPFSVTHLRVGRQE